MVQYVYDAWGNHAVLDANGNDLTDTSHIGNRNPFRYRGYFYDVETGLYYLQTRYYDPEIGRFLNMDDISYADPEQFHGLNLYAYCGNNPVMGYDPNGTWNWGNFWNLIASIAIVCAVAVGSVLTAGAAAAVFGASAAVTSAMIGGAAFGSMFLGGLEIGSQLINNGYGNINYGSVAIESFVGGTTGITMGAMGATMNAGVRLAMRGVNIGLNALGATFHCVNEGADAMGYLTGIGSSVAAGLIVNGFSILIDGRLGKLSTTLLEVHALNQVLFGIGNYAIKGLAIVGRSVWRTVGDKVTDFGKYLFGRLLR